MANRQPATVAQVVRVSQIIQFALIMGITSFGGVALMQVLGRVQPPDPSLLPWIMLGFGVLMLALRLIIPGSVGRQQLKRLAATGTDVDDATLATVYQTQQVIGSAFLEAGAFANLFSFMATSEPLGAGVAVLLAIGILIGFPTMGRVETWLAGQRQTLRDEQQLLRLSGK